MKELSQRWEALNSSIVVEDLYFAYNKGEEVLKGISLVFDERSTAIIGQNGAGKTTFAKLLKGLLKPDSGSISIKGIDTKNTTAAGLSRHIGLIFQNPNDQIFKSNVLDEVMFGPLNIMKEEKRARDLALGALEKVGLENELEQNPYDLTLSQRKLIAIASVLAMDTEIVIFDEPTIAQDHRGKEMIKGIIRELVGMGKLVLTIMHDMDFVAETFERTIVFSQGQVALDGSTREVFTREQLLKEAGLERPHVTRLGAKLGCSHTFLTAEEFVSFAKKSDHRGR